MDDRAFRIAVVVVGHLMWLSTAAIRARRHGSGIGQARGSGWLIELYPYLVWIPLLVAAFFGTGQVEIPTTWKLAGIAIALAGSAAATWSMWTGRGSLRFAGILDYHLGAALALESVVLAAATVIIIAPYTVARAAAERRTAPIASGTAP